MFHIVGAMCGLVNDVEDYIFPTFTANIIWIFF